MDKKKIETLQALRFFAILFVFIEHTGMTRFIGTGGIAVSFFFILSGFVLVLGSKNQIPDSTLKACVKFVSKKLSKFYPLHIVTQLASAFLLVLMFVARHDHIISNSISILKKLIINLLLISSYIPVKGYYMNEINGASWFLSTIMFMYLISIPVLKFAKIIEKKKALKYLCILGILVILYVLALIFNNTSWSEYVLYVCPLVRSLDYLMGAIFATIYIDFENCKLPNALPFTLFELLTIVLLVVNHTFLNGTINMICLPIMILVFSFEQGYISKILRNKFLIYLGNISFNIYILHQVVIQYVTTFHGWNTMSTVISAIVTLLCAVIAFRYSTVVIQFLKEKIVKHS